VPSCFSPSVILSLSKDQLPLIHAFSIDYVYVGGRDILTLWDLVKCCGVEVTTRAHSKPLIPAPLQPKLEDRHAVRF
jgi:hypothetical protein